MLPANRWEKFGTSIFTVMTQLAVKANAVNLAQGFPDFDGPEEIKDAAIAAIRGNLNQYAPAPGLPELRRLVAAKRQADGAGLYDPDTEVTIFSGATEAIFCALQGLLEPGDEVIAFEPTYDSYPAAAFAAGARLVTVPLVPPDWRFYAAALRRAVTPRTRAILVNTPHNPTGRVFDLSELSLIRDIAVERDLLVITDEVYEAIVFPPARHVSPATLPGLRERTVAISSTSKTYSFTGWKVGYALAPEPLMRALRAVHQFTVFCSATPLQAGMIKALSLDARYYVDLARDYQAKRDTLLEILAAAGFRATAPEGTYFALADYSSVRDCGDVAFAKWLTSDCGVAAIPVSVFCADPRAAEQALRYVRFAFCKRPETLAAARSKLLNLKSK